MCGCSFPSARIHTRTCKFMDKIPQIAKEKFDMTMDKTQETKLQNYKSFLLTSAKAKKFRNGSKSTRLYTAISLQLRRF